MSPVEVEVVDVVLVGAGFTLIVGVAVTFVCVDDAKGAQLERNSNVLVSAKESQEKRGCLALPGRSGGVIRSKLTHFSFYKSSGDFCFRLSQRYLYHMSFCGVNDQSLTFPYLYLLA